MVRPSLLLLLLCAPWGCASGPPSARAARHACDGGDLPLALRLMGEPDRAALRALADHPETRPEAKTGLEAMLLEHYLEAAQLLIPALERSGATYGPPYQRLELRVAEALMRAGLYLPAAERYEQILERGTDHVEVGGAIEGLLAVHALVRDPDAPFLIDRRYSIDLSQVSPLAMDQMHRVIGERELRQRKIGEGLAHFRAISRRTELSALGRQAEEGMGQILEKSGQHQPFEADALALERALGIPSKEADLAQLSCEAERERERVEDEVPPGAVQKALLFSIEKHRGAVAGPRAAQ
ncbi:MAG: hypothetical protein U1E65_12170 [Myxococcota bacterium]